MMTLSAHKPLKFFLQDLYILEGKKRIVEKVTDSSFISIGLYSAQKKEILALSDGLFREKEQISSRKFFTKSLIVFTAYLRASRRVM